MALPSVKINFSNGALGRTAATTDGVVGLILPATTDGNFSVGVSYLLKSPSSLNALNIAAGNLNPLLIELVNDFYKVAGNGASLWIMGTGAATGVDAASIEKIVRDSQYEVKTVFAVTRRSAAPQDQDGFNIAFQSDISACNTASQNLLNNYQAPISIVLDGNYHYQGNASNLKNFRTTGTFNRLSIFLGKKGSAPTSTTMIGYLMGRVATSPVHRNIGRVKDGPIFTGNLYVGIDLAENHDVSTIHDRGYISLRTFVGKSGYYFTDDNMLAATSDDYSQLAYRRVVDKAYRIAFTTIINELLDELPVNANGTIQAHKARVIEALITSAISNNMTAFGELNTLPDDPKDKGVVVTVDETNNVLSTGEVKVTVGVRPYGYARLITLQLGFKAS